MSEWDQVLVKEGEETRPTFGRSARDENTATLISILYLPSPISFKLLKSQSYVLFIIISSKPLLIAGALPSASHTDQPSRPWLRPVKCPKRNHSAIETP